MIKRKGHNKMKTKNYRVFMTRIFRNTKFLEVKATSEKEAKKLALKYANENYNPYELLYRAVDNGFCEITSNEIKKLGYQIDDNTKPFKIKKVFESEKGKVYKTVDEAYKKYKLMMEEV